MLADAPPAPILFTGALENRPDLVARLPGPLWGNPPEVLRAIRNPSRWSHCLQRLGLPCPRIAEVPPSNGRWLLKPRRGAGGLGICRYTAQPFEPRKFYLQEWIDGLSCSAVYVANDNGTCLLGVTQQLTGTPWLHARAWQYAGSIGPLALDAQTAERWRRLGTALAQEFRLRGLFGIDAIVRDGVPWPVEINPRYTASLEIIERSDGIGRLPWHRHAFEPGTRCPSPNLSAPTAIWGKGILYARQSFYFPADGLWLTALADGADLDRTEYADIPAAGEFIESCRPVLTLFASASSVLDCTEKLQELAQALDRRLWG